MTTLIQKMREELVRRAFAETTIRSYLFAVEDFRRHMERRLDQLGPDDLRRYQVYLLEDKKLARGTVVGRIAALRFFYMKVLKRRDMKEDLPYPKRQKPLPIILSQEETSRLIACARNLFHRAMILTMYAAGLRRSELCRLKVSNIDSQRMMLRIELSKGGVDRDIPLSKKLLLTLREYWRWMRPKTYLFPGMIGGFRADKPITPKVIWEAVQEAAQRAGIEKHVTPHTLRHTYATHLLEAGADLRTIQMLLGHADIAHTALYLQVSQKHLQAAPNPLDRVQIFSTANVPRPRRRFKPE